MDKNEKFIKNRQFCEFLKNSNETFLLIFIQCENLKIEFFLSENLGFTWFSASQRAFKFKLVSVNGKCCNLLPDTSNTCNSRQVPISEGTDRNWFSRSDNTPKLTKFPICAGKYSKRFRSALKFVNWVKSPTEVGNSQM